MHEVSIVQSITDIIMEKSLDNNIKKVREITLKIGKLSGVNEECIRFAFSSITKGTIMEGAILEIYSIDGEGFCENCNSGFKIDHYNKQCPICMEFTRKIVSGYELLIDSFEGD